MRKILVCLLLCCSAFAQRKPIATGGSGVPNTWSTNGPTLDAGGGNLRNSREQHKRPVRGWTALGNGSLSTTGATSATTGTPAGVGISSTEPIYVSFTTGAVSGNQSGEVAQGASSGLVLAFGRNNYWESYIKLANADLTNIRWVAGFENLNSFAGLNADTFNSNHVALFRFSSVANDTNFKCLTSNGSATTVTDSGVAGDTAAHWFEIFEDNANSRFLFYIDNVNVCTVTATLPASGTTMQWTELVTTQTTAAKVMDVAWVRVLSDK